MRRMTSTLLWRRPRRSGGQSYTEKTFGDLLRIEQKRLERSGQPLLLLLIDLKEQEATSMRIDPLVASALFENLRLGLRETDIVGWYRGNYVIGAVLTELGRGNEMEVSHLIGERLRGLLCEGLYFDVTRRLRVRIFQGSDMHWTLVHPCTPARLSPLSRQ
jgi:hypothetical protein